MSLLASGFSRYWASFILICIKGFVGLLVFWFMGYWVYELLDLWVIGSLFVYICVGSFREDLVLVWIVMVRLGLV